MTRRAGQRATTPAARALATHPSQAFSPATNTIRTVAIAIDETIQYTSGDTDPGVADSIIPRLATTASTAVNQVRRVSRAMEGRA